MFTLTAADLASKWGFHDGDLLDDLIYDYYPRDYDSDLHHRALRVLVRRHLVPLLPEDVQVYDIETIHNPIRTDHWGTDYDPDKEEPPDISVEVTREQALDAIREERG